jgi:hypothetical protein
VQNWAISDEARDWTNTKDREETPLKGECVGKKEKLAALTAFYG